MKIINKIKASKIFSSVLVATMFLTSFALPAGAAITPTTVTKTLNAGESFTINSTVDVPNLAPKVDVVFAFDLTGSMSGILDTAKTRSVDIMTKLDALGIDINYGTTSFMDYNNYYFSFDYGGRYGGYGDYAYKLNKEVTSDRSQVLAAINGLTLGGGSDGPESYTRVLYESYADSAIKWRTGAKKVLVMFGDNVPHDNNLLEGIVFPGIWSTGGDPGRDETMFTEDDLDLQTVLGKMKEQNIELQFCDSYGSYKSYWDQWAAKTGGNALETESGTMVNDVVSAISSAVTSTSVSNLRPQASAGFESWLVSNTPTAYTGPTGTTVNFASLLNVPSGTAPGTYNFTISALDEGNVSYGDTAVSITVPGSSTCTHIPTLTWQAPLGNNTTTDIPISAVAPITFSWGCPDTFVIDKTIAIRIRNAATNTLVTAYTYGAGIVIDEATKTYRQDFNPADFSITAGTKLKVMVYFGGKLKGTTYLNVK